MIWTHVLICGRWAWAWLTPAKWASLAHIGRYALLGKTPHIVAGAVGLACAAGIGGIVLLPALPARAPVISASPWDVWAPTATPEPPALLGFVEGLAALIVLRRRRPPVSTHSP